MNEPYLMKLIKLYEAAEKTKFLAEPGFAAPPESLHRLKYGILDTTLQFSKLPLRVLLLLLFFAHMCAVFFTSDICITENKKTTNL